MKIIQYYNATSYSSITRATWDTTEASWNYKECRKSKDLSDTYSDEIETVATMNNYFIN